MRAIRLAATLAVALVVGPAAFAVPAQAAGVDAVCVGTGTTTYSPAVTAVPQTITTTTTISYTCTTGATSATTTGRVVTVSNGTCLPILTAFAPYTDPVAWTGGSGAPTSSLNITSSSVTGTVFALLGTVSSGRFAGDSVQQVAQLTAFNGTGVPTLCPLGLGTISSTNAAITMTIESL